MLKQLLLILCLISSPLLAKPTLTIYTTSSFASSWGPGPIIAQQFEQTCDCQVKLQAVSDGVSMLNRLKMEGKRTKADMVLGFDNSLLVAAEQSGFFAPHQLDLTPLHIPNGWQDRYFVPYDYGYFSFIYNREKITTPPHSLQELLDSDKAWTIIYQDPRTSTPGFGLMLWLEKVYGNDTDKVWQKIAQRTVTVTKGWSEAYGLFLKGEADFVLSYTTSPAYHILDQQDQRYAAALFKEGHYLQIESMALLADSQNAELARKFMRFMLTPAIQQHIMMKNWMYPVIDIPVPNAFTPTGELITALSFSPEEVAAHRTQWLQTWQNSSRR